MLPSVTNLVDPGQENRDTNRHLNGGRNGAALRIICLSFQRTFPTNGINMISH